MKTTRLSKAQKHVGWPAPQPNKSKIPSIRVGPVGFEPTTTWLWVRKWYFDWFLL